MSAAFFGIKHESLLGFFPATVPQDGLVAFAAELYQIHGFGGDFHRCHHRRDDHVTVLGVLFFGTDNGATGNASPFQLHRYF